MGTMAMGTRGNGQWTMTMDNDNGQWTRLISFSLWTNGQWGQEAMGKGQWTMDNGQGTMDKADILQPVGQWIMDNDLAYFLDWGISAVAENVILDRSKAFAIRIIRLYQYLTETKREFVLSKQLLRSGTSIGANVREANQAQTKKDFASKMNIALKEAAESEYWLELLYETEYLTESEYTDINSDCVELNKLLISIVKSSIRISK
jgi:four helix bundle protein